MLLLASCLPNKWAKDSAEREEVGPVRQWLIVALVFGYAFGAVRALEFTTLNVHWDTNAYGTAAWTIVATHATLLLLDVADTIGLTLFYWLKPMPIKAMSDVADNSFYWYFMVLVWVPLYLIVYVGPYVF